MKILVDSMPIYSEDCAFADICWRNDEWEPYCTLGPDGVSECDLKDGQCSFLKALEGGGQ